MTPTSRHPSVLLSKMGKQDEAIGPVCVCMSAVCYPYLRAQPFVYEHLSVYMCMCLSYMCAYLECMLSLTDIWTEMWSFCQTAGSGNSLAKRRCEKRWRQRYPLVPCLPQIRDCSERNWGDLKRLPVTLALGVQDSSKCSA